MSVSMTSAIKAVKDSFEKNNFVYDYDDSEKKFSAKFNLGKTKLGSMDVKIRVRPTSSDPSCARLIIAHTYVSLKADDDCMAQVAEYLTRANYGLNIGNFELDFRDGEIRYKVALNCLDALPGPDAIDDLCAVPSSMYNRYGNGLLAVAMGMMTAEEAIKKAEA